MDLTTDTESVSNFSQTMESTTAFPPTTYLQTTPVPITDTTGFPNTTSSISSAGCNSYSDCGTLWWEIVGPIFGFLCLFILFVASCKCFMELCRKCCNRRGQRTNTPPSNRRHRRRGARSGRVSNQVEDGHTNEDYVTGEEDLPPDYFSANIRDGSVIFRVATIDDDLQNGGSRSHASSISEKLPTYDDIMQAKQKEALESANKTVFVIENEHVASPDEEERPATSQDLNENERGISRSSSSDSIEPPAYS